MTLSEYQISKIYKKIDLILGNSIVMINVLGDKSVPQEEKLFNLYCVNDQYDIVWQINESNTVPPFPDDAFVYMKNDKAGQITANRFSGFEYMVDVETGEAKQIGFNK